MTKRRNGRNDTTGAIGKLIQGDIPLTARPYQSIGENAGVDEKTVIEILQRLLLEGKIRKFGAILRHQRAGYARNAMVVWAVPPEKTGQTGSALSACKEVTHCYERTPPFEGRYNLFTMVHFQEGEDPAETVGRLARNAMVTDCKILESLEEFKKSSMEYFGR